MSTYTLPELLQKWARSELSLEQARPAGPRHLLQHLLGVGKQVSEIDKPGALRARQLEELSKPQG